MKSDKPKSVAFKAESTLVDLKRKFYMQQMQGNQCQASLLVWLVHYYCETYYFHLLNFKKKKKKGESTGEWVQAENWANYASASDPG